MHLCIPFQKRNPNVLQPRKQFLFPSQKDVLTFFETGNRKPGMSLSHSIILYSEVRVFSFGCSFLSLLFCSFLMKRRPSSVSQAGLVPVATLA
ncbi:hypothetical protein CEXT_386211 [Caerostris extrusa]|uniref:Ycf15 n=1 Tax=Caerostris extrusa TaxID=172846 RepID=A0AAV4XSC5_CAEEX|nr:hypothetical protein CEXT_386211 [Caerostris extrusa]